MNALIAAEPTNADAIRARILTVRGVQVMASCGLLPRKRQSRRGSRPIRQDMISMREACPQPNLKKAWENTAVKVYGYEGMNVIGIDF